MRIRDPNKEPRHTTCCDLLSIRSTPGKATWPVAIRFASAGPFLAVDVDALELASRNPVTQFSAAAALGRHYVGCGDLRAGTRWLERAVAATPERPEDGFAVKHELAGALEHLGESAQALAVLIDLDLDSGGYQDGRARIDKLMAAQVRGAECRSKLSYLFMSSVSMSPSRVK